MRSAIYYPHTTIRSEEFLKTALLLWDEVHVIVPWNGYKPKPSTRSEAAAFELVGRTLHPTEEEKRQAHELIEDFVTRPLPHAFFLDDLPEEGEPEYEMYAPKLLHKTWDLLRRAKMAKPAFRRYSHFSATRPTGLALMNLLADCCAGDTFSRTTDRGDAYASLAGLFLENTDHSDSDSGDDDRVGELFTEMRTVDNPLTLVPLAIEVVDLSPLTLEQVISFRESEARSNGSAIRSLRHNFSDSIDKQAKRLAAADSPRQADEIKRQFREDMNQDYDALHEALKLETKQVLGSKEIIGSTLVSLSQIAAGFHTFPGGVTGLSYAAAAIALGGLYSTKSKFALTRRNILEDHPTAYLYEARGGIRF